MLNLIDELILEQGRQILDGQQSGYVMIAVRTTEGNQVHISVRTRVNYITRQELLATVKKNLRLKWFDIVTMLFMSTKDDKM